MFCFPAVNCELTRRDRFLIYAKFATLSRIVQIQQIDVFFFLPLVRYREMIAMPSFSSFFLFSRMVYMLINTSRVVRRLNFAIRFKLMGNSMLSKFNTFEVRILRASFFCASLSVGYSDKYHLHKTPSSTDRTLITILFILFSYDSYGLST